MKTHSSINNSSSLDKSFAIAMPLGSVAWANQTLKNCIADLKEGAKSEGSWLWNQRLSVVLIYKQELEDAGYPWQAQRVENWIHRLQPRKADLEERERGTP